MKLKDVCIKGTSNIRQKDVNDSGRYPVYGAAGPVGFMNSFQYDEPYVGVVKDGAGIGRATYLPSNSSIIGTMQALIPKKNVLPKYLYYAVSSMHLEKYYSGATIPHIYFKNYKHERFVLVSKKEQEQIIWRFSLLEKMISNKQQQLLKLDELIKARFVEMFGDPISNKKSWKKRLLNDLVDKIGSGATPKGGKESYQDHGISFIRSMNVHDGYFNYKDLAYINSTQAKQLSNVIVQSQDVFINITGASVARSCIVPDDILPARVNQHVSIIRCKSDVLNPIFINNLFLNDSFKRILLSIGLSGGATRQAITKKQLEMLKIILPPISLQNEYANFVHQVDKSKFENIVYLNKTLLNKILSQIGDVIRD
ncbi:restriction endonuclease subunit S [Limosilactobacillus reuteri]|uniref:restriction endonuclease subunit S n=5 Tax=Limosilactobacillus reuteri TaxID=1598 RepID=UPI001E439631|nr:restriction endonuclease subunit S [Limosilactobacillus reuteri]MCC4447974.1 restriction endonuclease subunit S [Limosilactobacillus reuteri]MCC4471774.1 restriction endonuclease subunit S [Limosilactobacillus reuteri]UPG79437.1 restriction endonuclease subunit S [Limosilactobacillus reuteri]